MRSKDRETRVAYVQKMNRQKLGYTHFTSLASENGLWTRAGGVLFERRRPLKSDKRCAWRCDDFVSGFAVEEA